jgi:ABC-2 type transport system permease protein
MRAPPDTPTNRRSSGGSYFRAGQVTSIVNTIRDLLAQQPTGNAIWIALAWCVGVLLVAYTFAMLAYRRKIA